MEAELHRSRSFRAALLRLSLSASVKSVAPPKLSMSMDWNLNIQRQLAQNTSFTIAYVGSRSIHMPNNIDETNVVLPTGVNMDGVNRFIWPNPIGSGKTLNPNFGDIHYLPWDDNGFYDGLQLGLTKRLSKGFQVQGSYTWSRCIDYGSNMNIGDPFNNSIASLFYFANKEQRRGLCDYNINHAMSVNYLWNIPKPGWANGAVAQVLGGWSVGGIITAQTGTPFTVGMGGDPWGRKARSSGILLIASALLLAPTQPPAIRPISWTSVALHHQQLLHRSLRNACRSLAQVHPHQAEEFIARTCLETPGAIPCTVLALLTLISRC